MEPDSKMHDSVRNVTEKVSPTASSSKKKNVEEMIQSIEKLQIEESSSTSLSNFKRKPVVILVIGMSGSGKTTFMRRLLYHTHTSKLRVYVVNLDPAVSTLPFRANCDIRDAVDYKDVMEQFNLGPNGGILTSLDLFASNFGEVISTIERTADLRDYVLVDTVGLIEAFTWSGSGTVIAEAFASTFPTVIAYVVDTQGSSNPNTFMSNMMSACSIRDKKRLPLVLAFNKTDVAQHQFALEWMEDFMAFHAALETDQSHTSSLSRSLSFVLDQLHQNVRSVGVSALSGAGMNEFFKAIDDSATEFMETYKVDLEKRLAEMQRLEENRVRQNMKRLRRDLQESNPDFGFCTGLKDKENAGSKNVVQEDEVKDEEEKYDEDEDDFETFSTEKGVTDDDDH